MVDETQRQIVQMNKSLLDISKQLKDFAVRDKESSRIEQRKADTADEDKLREIEETREKERRDEAVLDALQDIGAGLKVKPGVPSDAFGLKELLLGFAGGLAALFLGFTQRFEKFFRGAKATFGKFGKLLKSFRLAVTGFFGRITKLFKNFKFPKIGKTISAFFLRFSLLFKKFKFPKFPVIFESIKGFFIRIGAIFKKIKIPKFTVPAGLKAFFASFNPGGLFVKLSAFFKRFAGAPLKILQRVVNSFKSFGAFIKAMPIIGKILPFLSKIASKIFIPLTAILAVGSGLIESFDAIKRGEDLLGIIAGFFSGIIDVFSIGLFPAKEVKALIVNSFGQMLDAVKGIVEDGLDFGDLKKLFGALSTAVLGMGELIKNAVLKVIGAIGGFLGFDKFEQKVKELSKSINITKEVTKIVDRIVEFFGTAFNKILEFISNFNLSKITANLKSSITNQLSGVGNFLSDPLGFFSDDQTPNAGAGALARSSNESLRLNNGGIGGSVVNSLTGPTVNSVTNNSNVIQPQPKDNFFQRSYNSLFN